MRARLEVGRALRRMRALRLPAGGCRVGGHEEVAFRLTAPARRRRLPRMPLHPRDAERVQLRLLAPALVVVAIPDPRAVRLHAVPRLRQRPVRVEVGLALHVDRSLLGRAVTRRPRQEVALRIHGEVDVHVHRLVRDRVVGARDASGEQAGRALHDAADGAAGRRRPRRREVAVVHVRPVGREAGVDLRRVALAAVGDRLHVRVGLLVGEPPRRGPRREHEHQQHDRETSHTPIIDRGCGPSTATRISTLLP